MMILKNNYRDAWVNKIDIARGCSQQSKRVARFKNLPSEQARRASYFGEMSGIIGELGISNPHERSALSIEPTHPVPLRYMGSAISKLGFDNKLLELFDKSKMSLISLPLLNLYAPESEAKGVMVDTRSTSISLLDPLYGFAFFKRGGAIRNHCFAIDVWRRHIASMPKSISSGLWKNRADNFLSGGAFAGREIFHGIIPDAQSSYERSMVPEICISTEGELQELVRSLKISAKRYSEVELWFRGQKTEYRVPDRSDLIQLGIAPYSNVVDSDLTPSLYRKYDSVLESFCDYEKMILELAEWVYWANNISSSSSGGAEFFPTSGAAAISREGLGAYQRGLVLQQYGAPSAFLDITSDELIAAWFAVNSCQLSADSKMKYSGHSWVGDDARLWPTIFVFPLVKGLHPFLNLGSILEGSGALRPKRQKCGLLGGAGNLARNYCARYIGLKIRLKPGFKLNSDIKSDTLFPSSAEDKVLDGLQQAGLGDSRMGFRLTDLA